MPFSLFPSSLSLAIDTTLGALLRAGDVLLPSSSSSSSETSHSSSSAPNGGSVGFPLGRNNGECD